MIEWSTLSARELRKRERDAEDALQPRQVAFCRGVALEGMQKLEAYKAAGYEAKRPDVQSSKMLRRDDIQQLLAIYAETAKRRAIITGQTLQLHIWDVMEKAYDGGDYSNTLRSAELLAKMTGNMVEKQEIKHEGAGVVPQMDQETLREAFKAKRLRAVGDDKE